MATPRDEAVTSEEFRRMAEMAGLGMSQDELDALKPLYELYSPYIKLLHSIEFGAEEIGVTFHPDWPSA